MNFINHQFINKQNVILSTIELISFYFLCSFQHELVEFYYLWKKTPGANNNRPHRRRRQGSLRRIRNTRTNSNASNNNKKEQTPEPIIEQSRPSPISKEENSSVTEDDASECDSDSSATNKGSQPANSEFGEDSPSRMRTRNKQKDQNNLAVKRPRRGGAETPETVVADSPKTPNKITESTSKRKGKGDTPQKGKKRSIDMEDGSDEKDLKRKRSDSPAESLTTDSRPGSVLDEAESNSEPSEINVPTKDTEEKDPLSLDTRLSNPKEEESVEGDLLLSVSSSPQPSQAVVLSTATPPITEETSDTIASPISQVENDTPDNIRTENTSDKDDISRVDNINESMTASNQSTSTASSSVKEHEMLSKLANMKQEINSNSNLNPNEYPTKDVSFIKKEPNEDAFIDSATPATTVPVVNNNKTNLNNNGEILPGSITSLRTNSTENNEPEDLKLKMEIKSETKSAIANEQQNSTLPIISGEPHTQSQPPRSPPTPPQQSQPPSESSITKFDAENLMVSKPGYEGHLKFGTADVPLKFGPGDGPIKFDKFLMSESSGKYGTQPEPPSMDYDMKSYMDASGHMGAMKGYPESPFKLLPGGPPPDPSSLMKQYPQDLGLMKYPSPEEVAHLKYNPPPDSLHSQQQPPGTLRHPFDPLMKFDPMMKYGMPPSSQPQDLKYIPPPVPPPSHDPHMSGGSMKYPPMESSQKSQQFSADNLIKGSTSSSYSAEMKYSPPQTPNDVSSRITPNQDSQGSNSNSQTAHPPGVNSNSSPMVLTSQSSLLIPQSTASIPSGPFTGHPGLSHPGLPANHPSLMTSNSSSSTNAPPSLLSQGPPLSSSHNPAFSISAGIGLGNSSQQPNNLASMHRPQLDLSSSRHHGSSAPVGPSHLGVGPPPPQSQAPPVSGHSMLPIHSQSSSPAGAPRLIDSNPMSREMTSHRGSPLGPGAGGPPLMGHHPMPLHLGHPGMGLPPHHPAHLGGPLGHNPLMSGSMSVGAGPLSLIGGPPVTALGSLMDVASAGRPRSPPSIPSSTANHHQSQSSLHNSSALLQSPSTPTAISNPQTSSSSISRASPSVQQSHTPTGAFSHHRPASPSSLSGLRTSPLHLVPQSPVGHHSSSSSLAVAAAAASAERERHIMRQQSPHMTPPPPSSSASSLMSSPLSKFYGQPGQHQRGGFGSSPPPHHFRPGASPPVMRHPTMPLPLPLIPPSSSLQSPVLHPSQNPYPHLLHASMFYPHAHHNPFNTHYPYPHYGPSFAYMKPPGHGNPLDNPMLQHHPTSIPPRTEESPHSEKSSGSSSQKPSKPSPASKPPQSNSGSSASSNNNQPPPSSASFVSPHQFQPGVVGGSHPFMENPHSSKTTHMDALRAHAHAASGGMSGGHHSMDMVPVETLDIDPDPEPPSPVHNIDRGPSPEAKLDDAECHRSQSAM